MKVRIEADGTMGGTRLVTEDGRDITKGITSVQFSHHAGGPPRVELDLIFPAISGAATATLFHTAPDGERKAIRRIEYADGTAFEPDAP